MAAEKNLDNKVLSFLKSKNCWCIKYWSGARYTKAGVPDILACVDGQFFAIEDKAKNGKPTLLQIVTLKKIRLAFGFGILLYPDEFENFKRFLLFLLYILWRIHFRHRLKFVGQFLEFEVLTY